MQWCHWVPGSPGLLRSATQGWAAQAQVQGRSRAGMLGRQREAAGCGAEPARGAAKTMSLWWALDDTREPVLISVLCGVACLD